VLVERRKFIQECDYRILELHDRAMHLQSRLAECNVQLAAAAAAPAAVPAAAAQAPAPRDTAYSALPGYGTTVRIDKAGTGPAVAEGDTVTVHATGVIGQSGSKFWSTHDPGQAPFTYRAGVGGVITGWDQGCLGMQVGETRSLRIPAAEGYGSRGFPAWGIPPGATLEFTLECLSIA